MKEFPTMIITIDGPTASGKSTIARSLAQQLGYMHINSGLLFRALAYVLYNKVADHHKQMSIELFKEALNEDHAFLEVHAIENACKRFSYLFTSGAGSEILLCGKPITDLLKNPKIDQAASLIGTHVSVRQVLLDYQRTLANDYNIVADGRDCGTVVFPHADYKFFLTASLDVRASRLGRAEGTLHHSFEETKKAIVERDARDSQRSLAPLMPASDSYIIDSSHMTVQEVITEMISTIGMAASPKQT